jgi:hypothetical protein
MSLLLIRLNGGKKGNSKSFQPSIFCLGNLGLRAEMKGREAGKVCMGNYAIRPTFLEHVVFFSISMIQRAEFKQIVMSVSKSEPLKPGCMKECRGNFLVRAAFGR